MAAMHARTVVASSTLFMDRTRPPGGAPGPNQLRIPTPHDLVRMRQLRQQQQQQQQQLARQRQRPPLQRSREQSQPPGPLRRRSENEGEDEGWEEGEEDARDSEAVQQSFPLSKQQAPAAQPAPAPTSQQQAAPWRLGSVALPPQTLQQQQLGPRVPPPQPRVPLPRSARQPGKPGPRDVLFAQLAEECSLEDAWRPQVLLLYELGLRAPDFDRLAETRPEIFQMGVVSMRRKLKFFRDAIGLSDAELTRVITKFPRILEYKSERTIRPRLDFLRACGVEQSDLAKVFTRAPMALELRVRDTLEPRAAFLRDVLCLSPGALGKLIVRHPQVLTCTQEMMQLRVDFLRDQGLGQEALGRAVLAHPQVLHYKIDSMRERVSFLRGCGLDQAQVAACCARFPQIFSLNVEANLAPKWRYLVDYIRTPADGVATLCSYPAYFSLSLTNRVVPRHRFFLHVHAQRPKARRKGADQSFSMSHLKCSDAQFAKLCGRPLEDYEQFKQLFGGSSSGGAAELP